MKLLKLTAAAILAVSSLSASAGLISVVGGNVASIPTVEPKYNNFMAEGDLPVGQSYNIGGNVVANANIVVEYFFLGHEAGWDNHFVANGLTISTSTERAFLKCSNANGHGAVCDTTKPKNPGYVVPKIVDTINVGQFLNFSFWTLTSGNPYTVSQAVNGSNTTNQTKYNFATALNTSFHGTAYDAILFLDDTGRGANGLDDDNHDDMLIGLRVRHVPEPSTLLLIGLGILGLAGTRRLKA